MEKWILIIYSILFLTAIILKSILNYRKTIHSGAVLYAAWKKSTSVWELTSIALTIYFLAYTIAYRLDRGYIFLVIFTVAILLNIIFDSRLILTDQGISFRNDFIKWCDVYEINTKGQELRIIARKRIYILSEFKTIKLSRDEVLIAIVKEKYSDKVTLRR